MVCSAIAEHGGLTAAEMEENTCMIYLNPRGEHYRVDEHGCPMLELEESGHSLLLEGHTPSQAGLLALQMVTTLAGLLLFAKGLELCSDPIVVDSMWGMVLHEDVYNYRYFLSYLP